MIRSANTINAISSIFCAATKEVLEVVTAKEINYAKTIQKIPIVHLRPDIGCFVMFNGDYSGLMIMNFSAESAMAIYRSSMMNMGMPADELASEYTADDVVDNIGETINQIIGNVRRQIEMEFGLVAFNTQPKAIALNTSIILTIDAHDIEKELSRRLSFKIDGHSFHIELSMEKTEFITMDGKAVKDSGMAQNGGSSKPDIDSMMKNAENENSKKTKAPASKSISNANLDFDALMNQAKED